MIAVIKIICLLGFLILIHELGHYTVAKMCKITVNEFSIGFGPKLISKEYKSTLYELRLIPLGGFVKLEGEEEQSEKEGSFNKASIPKRIVVLVAGAGVNIIFGIILYVLLITIRYAMVANGSLWDAIGFGMNAGMDIICEMAKGIFQMITGGITLNDMTGPVGISSMVSKTNGLTEFLYLLSIISISLGITNLLPIIPLDGGKVLLLIIEAIRKKPLNQETELRIQSAGFILLIIFSIIVTVHDVIRL